MARWNPETIDSDLTNFSDNPALIKKLKARRIKRACILFGIVLIVGLSAKPCYRAFRQYQVNRNLAAAKAAARIEDWATARDKARSVLLARRQDFEAFRIWTQALGKTGEARAYVAAAQLFTDPRASRADRLDALQVMATQAPQAVALSAYGSLPKSLRDEAAFRAAITPLLVQRRQIDIAEKGLREVAKPTDEPMVQLELLRTLCSRPEAKRVSEARGLFANLIARNADTEALAALLILGETPGGLAPGEPLPDLPKWLRDQPKATTLHHLIAMHPSLEALPKTVQRQYEAAVKRFLVTDPGVLGTWLVRHGKAEMAAEILEKPAKTRSDAYLARLHALLRLKRNAEIEAALAAPPDSVDLMDLEILRALMASRRGEMSMADSAWTRALNQASFDANRNRFIEIAHAAEGYRAVTAAENAWVASIRSGWGQLPLYQDLQPIFASLAAKGRTEDLLAMYRTLMRFEPLNPHLNNNFYYLALLHGLLPPERIVAEMTKLVTARPELPEFSTTLMLAEMLDGHAAKALTRLPQLRESRRVAPMMKTALEGSARVLAGETEAGTALLQQVKWQDFLRQERIVFRDMLVKLKISELPLPALEPLKADINPDQVPAWRKAVERHEKDRAKDVLPALPNHAPVWRKAVEREVKDRSSEVLPPAPEQTPAWRKAVERQEKDRTKEVLPPLPAPKIPGKE